MINKDAIKRCITESSSNFSFDTVSDLSKDDFLSLLCTSLDAVLNSKDFIHHISTELAAETIRHNRGEGRRIR